MTNVASGQCENSGQWAELLERQLALVKSGEDMSRQWTFDMDDRSELVVLEAPQFQRLKRALEFLQAELYPQWEEADRRAIDNQNRHRQVTRMAIGFGVTAVAAAIVSLVVSHLLPGVMLAIFGVELIAVIAALIAVIAGVWLKTHHEWLTKRQIAERLRSLRFQSVTWPELWCDEPRWQARTKSAMAGLVGLTDEQAEHWAKEADQTAPAEVLKPSCDVPAEELAALSSWYRVKRLEFQKHYFDFQANRTYGRSWGHRWKLSLKLFVASVIIVLCHGFVAIFLVQGHHDHAHVPHPPAPAAQNPGATQPGTDAAQNDVADGTSGSAAKGHDVQQLSSDKQSGHDEATAQDPHGSGHGTNDPAHHGAPAHAPDFWHGVEIVLIGLAALLPVVGFGIRAWTSAFESPRSHNLFRAKSLALNEPIRRLQTVAASALNYDDVMWTIAENEHFFVGEHHEWCRLQVEAEWYF
ncbi:MAG: DUF4231 domain-containing protein [Planctomycetaceae bacterium]|nr:DUF4231 domain-containing protein [Planctomycetaceae bacterium]